MNVAIIGGSITEGAGASNYEKSYFFKLQEYMNKRYGNVFLKNLGSGGTGSNFGLFRLKRDLGDFKPDIIFVEYSVNDRIFPGNEVNIYFEGLIRECFKFTDKIIIIGLPTGMSDSCVSIHKKFAYFYNIPFIDVQDEVWRKIGHREFTWTKISIDNIHPNDYGHEIYFNIIKEKLDTIDLLNIKGKIDTKVLSKYRFKNPHVIECDDKEIEYYGEWSKREYNLNNKFKSGAITVNIGDSMVYNFKGRYLGMLNLCSCDSGIVECELDGYLFNIDLYSENDGVFESTINLYGLHGGEHRLILKVSNKKNELSLGHKVVIGGFLVD